MMKKQSLLVIFMYALNCCGFASAVTEQKAQAIAVNFFKVNFPDAVGHVSLSAALKYTGTEADNSVDFYVFDISPAKGFVIVAADDIIIPILGYSNESYFNPDFRLIGLNSWVNKTTTNIRRAINARLSVSNEVTSQWAAYIQGVKPENLKSGSVNPLCTTTWDQENGISNPPPYIYNLFCPYNSTDAQRCLTGCVATAQAQIMKYWNYPAQGMGSFSYVDDTLHGYSNNYGTLSSDFAAHSYQWPSMPSVLTGSEWVAQDSAVDLLMYDCGVSLGMDFGDDNQGGSGAEALLVLEVPYGDSICSQYALVNYFSYDADTIKGVIEADYSASAWSALIEHELNMGRPVLYEGDDTTQGGHAWVCDGYDVNQKLHMNWGWSGADDGYFAINNLNTSGNFNPVLHDAALIGIMPKHTPATDVNRLSDAISFSMFPNPAGNQVVVKFDKSDAPATMNIADILGQTVISKNLAGQQTVIDLAALSNGIYLVQIRQDEKFAVKQLVVSK